MVRQTFSYHARFTVPSGINTVGFDPVNSPTLFGSQVQTMSVLYQEFRCVGLKIVIYPAQSAATTTGNSETGLAIGWRPMRSANPPLSIDDVMQSTKSVYVTDHLTTPVEFRISTRELRKFMLTKWLHNDVTPATDTCTHGDLYYASVGTNSTTAVWTWMIQSTWEFQAPVPLNQQLVSRLNFPDLRLAFPPAPSTIVAEDKDEKHEKTLNRGVVQPDSKSRSIRSLARVPPVCTAPCSLPVVRKPPGSPSSGCGSFIAVSDDAWASA